MATLSSSLPFLLLHLECQASQRKPRARYEVTPNSFPLRTSDTHTRLLLLHCLQLVFGSASAGLVTLCTRLIGKKNPPPKKGEKGFVQWMAGVHIGLVLPLVYCCIFMFRAQKIYRDPEAFEMLCVIRRLRSPAVVGWSRKGNKFSWHYLCDWVEFNALKFLQELFSNFKNQYCFVY